MSARAPERWTVLALLRSATDYFAENGIETARLDAELLLAHALGSERLQLYLDFEKPVTEEERARFRELASRRARERVPVAQLVGRKEFWSLDLRVTPEVLVPRPETETLVEAALACAPDRDAELAVLDLGTGSGAIALAVASERPKARVTATDRSAAALVVARENAVSLGLEAQVHFAEGVWAAPVRGERFDLVLSNPPYLQAGAERPPELRHEPAAALDAGDDGLAAYRELVPALPELLAVGGTALLEIAPDQVDALRALCAEARLEGFRIHADLAGRPRVVQAQAAQEA